MYGVPPNLDLAFLHGAELVQVCLGRHEVQFVFHPTGTLSVEGKWELLAGDGLLLDESEPYPRRKPFLVHRLLGQRVVGTRIAPPEGIELTFAGGESLRVFDSSAHHESFSIQPGDIVV